MFFHNIYGTNRARLGLYEPSPFQCPQCKELDTIDIIMYGDYFHFWYIPIFPYEKDGYAKCSNCGFTINSIKFNRNTKDLFQEIKRKFRYPFYTYTGAFILCSPFIVGILFFLFSKK
ncbi:MAG: zinc-ribbon domain-containing protein [Bacteroidota bacterium]|nr:zinc-ribbon domain-containing protein [Bacteroidota bacterium]